MASTGQPRLGQKYQHPLFTRILHKLYLGNQNTIYKGTSCIWKTKNIQLKYMYKRLIAKNIVSLPSKPQSTTTISLYS